MTIQACDKCQTGLSAWDSYEVGGGYRAKSSVELCRNCFQPYLELLNYDGIVPPGLENEAAKICTASGGE